MNRADALQLYDGRLVAAFPDSKRTPATRELWVDLLAGDALDVGRAALDDVLARWRSGQFPPPALYAEAREARRRAAAERGADAPAVEQPRVSRETHDYWVAKCREALAEARPPKPKRSARPVPHARHLNAHGEPIPLGDALAAAVDQLDTHEADAPVADAHDASASEEPEPC